MDDEYYIVHIPQVIIKPVESKVLDSNGAPFTITSQQKSGFDLSKKEAKCIKY